MALTVSIPSCGQRSGELCTEGFATSHRGNRGSGVVPKLTDLGQTEEFEEDTATDFE